MREVEVLFTTFNMPGVSEIFRHFRIRMYSILRSRILLLANNKSKDKIYYI